MKKKIILYCSPNLGVLENWLPIIYKLDKSKYSITLCLPKPGIINNISEKNPLLQISEKFFDSVYFISHFNNWFKSKNIKLVKKYNKINYIEKLFINLFSKKILSLLEKKVFKKFSNKLFINLKQEDLFSNCKIILYDVLEEERHIKIFNNTTSIHKFSLNHSNDIQGCFTIDQNKRKINSDNLNVLVNTEKQKNYYKFRNDINNNSFIIAPIPKHDPEWIKYIIANYSKNESNYKKKDYIFLISRPVTDQYLSFQEKSKILSFLKKAIIENMGHSIVIKLHPKEKRSKNLKLFYDILGKNNLNKNWFITDDHPMCIANDSKFVVSFVSGLPLDILQIGKFSIETFNILKAERFENFDGITDNNYNPFCNLRYYRLVLGANNFSELNKIIHKYDNGYNYENHLLEQYRKIFKNPFNAINDVIKIIENRIQ